MATFTDPFVLSPAEKKLVEPLLLRLDADKIAGKKEMVMNQPRQLGYESFDGTWHFEEAPELNKEMLMNILRFFAQRTHQSLDISNPVLSVKLPGGHRAQFIAGLQNDKGFSLAVRLHHERTFTIDDYKMSSADKAEIIESVKDRRSMLISGGTGTGKTSFMNVLLQYIPEDERLVTLEDVRELKVSHENWCAFTFGSFDEVENPRAGINVLLNAILRMRPDRILLGEIRRENAFTFCSAINTGHRGSLATVHANSPSSALDAVINRVLLNGDATDSAVNVLRSQLKGDIYGVVQLERKVDGVHAFFKKLEQD